MPCKLFILLFFFLALTKLNGQVDSIFAFPVEKRPFVIYDYFDQLEGDKLHRFNQMNRLQKAFETKNDLESAQLAWTLKQDDAYLFLTDLSLESKLAYYDKERIRAREKNWDLIENEILFRMGSETFNHGKFGHGLELMMESFAASQQIGWSSVFARLHAYISLGHSYQRFGDTETAIHYLEEVLKADIPKTCQGYPYKAQNSIGLCYQELGQYDSALYYMTLSHDNAIVLNDSFWMFLTKGNIGNAYLKSGDKDKALPYIEADYNGSIRFNEIGSAVNASSLLANIELKNGNTEKAGQYLKFADKHIDTASIESMVLYYANLFEYSKLSGDDHNAVKYADLLSAYKARKDKYLDKRILDQAKMKVAIMQYNSNIKMLEAAHDRNALMRDGLLVILFLVGLSAFLWIKRIELKRKSDLEKLSHAQNELSTFTKSLVEKNELIQSFKAELAQIHELDQDEQSLRESSITELINLSILKDEDWKRFRQLFEVVHPGFLIRLRDKFNDLTPAETRLLALVKLQLPVKDMADMLGISSESIYKTRYRLRKKINLPVEGSLEDLVEDL